MKKLLFILLITMAASAEAQRGYIYRTLGKLGDSLVEVPLPLITEWDAHAGFMKLGKSTYDYRDYVISTPGQYYQFFSGKQADSLPKIDFNKNELSLRWYCVQCMAFCHHDEKDNGSSCHRNRCDLTGFWVLNDKVNCVEPVLAIKKD